VTARSVSCQALSAPEVKSAATKEDNHHDDDEECVGVHSVAILTEHDWIDLFASR
jgi:hypothetical protein